MTVKELCIELQGRSKIPAGTDRPDLQEALLKTLAEPPIVVQDQNTTASVVQSDSSDEDPRVRARMSSVMTAGFNDIQLELCRLEMEERRMAMDLDARKFAAKAEERRLAAEERRVAMEAEREERRRQQEPEVEERRQVRQQEIEVEQRRRQQEAEREERRERRQALEVPERQRQREFEMKRLE